MVTQLVNCSIKKRFNLAPEVRLLTLFLYVHASEMNKIHFMPYGSHSTAAQT